MRRGAGLAALALAGCTVGPNFTPPSPPPPAAGYTPAAAAGVVWGDGPGDGWWQAFGSAELDAAVARALAGNPTLAASEATLERARQRIVAVRGASLPQVDLQARAEREEANLAAFGFSPALFGFPGNVANPLFNLFTIGGGVSFDLDPFGRNRRAIEGARADAEAQAWTTDAARQTIAARVVIQALTIAAIRERIAAETGIVAESRRNVDLTEARRQGGEGTLVEVLSARGQLSADEADLPALRQQLAEARDMLSVLVGVTPAELGPTDFTLAGFALPGAIPVAIPSTLVRRRPDIRAAEARLHSAVAAVGVATAALYPDIALGAAYSQAASSLGSLFTDQFRGFDLFGGVTAPIFHGGTLRANKRGAEAQARAAAAQYRQTLLEAFGQVSDLLAALGNDADGVASAQNASKIGAQSLSLSRRSFQVGNSGVLQVLDASRIDERAKLALADARAKQLLDTARLYAASTGGLGDAMAGAMPPAPTTPRLVP